MNRREVSDDELDAQLTVIGCVMFGSWAVPWLLHRLGPAAFIDDWHAMLYALACDLVASGHYPMPHVLDELLSWHPQHEEYGFDQILGMIQHADFERVGDALALLTGTGRSFSVH